MEGPGGGEKAERRGVVCLRFRGRVFLWVRGVIRGFRSGIGVVLRVY